MKHDIQTGLVPVKSLAIAARTASANGAGVDCSGYGGAFAYIPVQGYTDGTHKVKVQHSEDGSTWANVPVADVQCDATIFDESTGELVVDGAGDVGEYTIGYFGMFAHLRVVQTVTGSPSTGAIMGGTIFKGAARYLGALSGLAG